MSIWVCGEVLIDLIPVVPGSTERAPHVGGGPANTAKALARLGHDVHFIDGISTDAYGVMSREELLRDEVKLDLALTSDKPTCVVMLDLVHFKGVNDQYGHAGVDPNMRGPGGAGAESWRGALLTDLVGKAGQKPLAALAVMWRSSGSAPFCATPSRGRAGGPAPTPSAPSKWRTGWPQNTAG